MERAPWDTDEPDGFDEALIPCDATEDPLTWIMDDVILLQSRARILAHHLFRICVKCSSSEFLSDPNSLYAIEVIVVINNLTFHI